jgi:hypothetical protein
VFDGCTWDNPSTKGSGGGILLNGIYSTVISIKRCLFKNINLGTSYYSASFYIQNIASLNISSSSFHSLSASYCGVGWIYRIDKCVLFHNCKCVDCLSSSSYCGGLFLSSYSPSSESDCLNYSSRGCIFGCLFSNCISQNSYSGGLYLSSTSSSFSLRSSIFDSCKAKTDGGGIYMENMNSDVIQKTFLFYSFFSMEMNVEKEMMNMEVMFILILLLSLVLLLFSLVIQQQKEKGIKDVI